MVSLLENKAQQLDEEQLATKLPGFFLELGNLRRQLDHVRRGYDLATMVSGGVATLRVLMMARQLNPEPEMADAPKTAGEVFRFAFHELFSAGGIIRKYVFARDNAKPPPALEQIESELRHDIELLHEEARRRLGLRGSLRGIVNRYAARAMWHDASALRQLARTPRKAEELLTADFARYLHDQGLNPLTKPMTGGLQPDVLAPIPRWTFYAEAKQYSSASARAHLIKGVRQVWDTLGRLRGTPYEVREAFYVVFRLGGPRLVFPEELRSEGVVVYPVLIDIADPKETGSRQKKQPVALSEAELLPRSSSRRKSAMRA